MVAFSCSSESALAAVCVTREEAVVAVSGLLTALQYESCPSGAAECVASIIAKLSDAFDLNVSITEEYGKDGKKCLKVAT